MNRRKPYRGPAELVVEFSDVEAQPEFGYSYLPPAWRVVVLNGSWTVPGDNWAIGLSFSRQKDAELAAMALRKSGLDTVAKLQAKTDEELQQIMLEAMQW